MTIDYQAIVYDICNLLDAASSRSVARGTGIVVDEVVAEVKKKIEELYRLRAQVEDLTRHAEAMRAVMCRDCPARPNRPRDCHPGCAALEYRAAHPMPPESP